MAKLTEEQEAYLISHSIPLSAVFDASGIWKNIDYCKGVMKSLGKWIAFGTSPCRRAGHTLYTRSRHCIQCDPAKIAFMRRSTIAGYVYVAGSLSKEIIKVGQTNDPAHRVNALNEDEIYAGVQDWRLLYYAEVPSSGEVEFKAHRLLDDFAAPITYTFRRRQMDTLETFYCGCERAIQAIELSANTIYSSNRSETSQYEFPEITGHNFYRKGNRASHSDTNVGAVSSATQSAGDNNVGQDAFLTYIPKLHKKALQNGSLTVEEIIEELPFEERTEEDVENTVFLLEQLDVEVTGDLYAYDLPSREDLEDNLDFSEEENFTENEIPPGQGVTELTQKKPKNKWYDLTLVPLQVDELIADDDELSDEVNAYVVGLFKKLQTKSCLQAVLRVQKINGDENKFSLSRSILEDAELAKNTTSDEDEEDIEQPVSLRKKMAEVLGSLTPAQALVIKYTYGIDERSCGLTGLDKRSPSFVGAMVGLSYQTVTPLLKKALRRLKHPSKSRKLREYYGELIRLEFEYGDDFVDHLSREQSLLVEIVPKPEDPF